MKQPSLPPLLFWAEVIVGGLLLLALAAWSVYLAKKSAKGPREQAFLIRAIPLFWIWSILFGLGQWCLPSPYQYGLLPVYLVVLFFMIRYFNRRQAAIRAEESMPPAPESRTHPR